MTTIAGSRPTTTCNTYSTVPTRPLRGSRSPTTRPRCTPWASCFGLPPHPPAPRHSLGVVLQDAAARPLPQYAAPLFAALGVGDTVAWEPLDRGTVNGGAGIALRGRDLLKFGQLFLQRGWSGERSVVPEAWVDEATRPQFAW